MFRLIVVALASLLGMSIVAGKSFERKLNLNQTSSAGAGSAACQYSLTIAKTRFSQHEPILLTLVITNSSYELLPVSLGYDREGGFIFTVKRPDGSLKEIPRKRAREGPALAGNFSIEAQKTYTQQLILNEWYDFQDPGVYEINASLVKGRWQQEAACLNSRLKIEILPFDTAQVQQRCSDLVETIRQNTKNFGNASDAVKALLVVKHPIVVPFLEQAMKANHGVISYVISGLEEIGNEQAVRVLIPLLDNPDPENSDFFEARHALVAIEKKTTDPATLDLVRIALARVRQP